MSKINVTEKDKAHTYVLMLPVLSFIVEFLTLNW